MLTPVGWPIIFHWGKPGAGPSCFLTSGNCQRSEPKAAVSLEGPPALALVWTSPHSSPETPHQAWVPAVAFPCWRTDPSRTVSWRAGVNPTSATNSLSVWAWMGPFTLSLDFSSLTHRTGLGIHLFSHHLSQNGSWEERKSPSGSEIFKPMIWGIPQRSHWGSATI